MDTCHRQRTIKKQEIQRRKEGWIYHFALSIKLLKNNLYASIANIKWFAMSILIFGLIVICLDNDSRTLLLAFLLISIVGFPVNAIASLRKECGSKWCKCKLTVPVKR